MSVLFADCPKIPFWSVLSSSCCCLFKIYISYIIAKCRSVKMRNIAWFLVPHFYLLSVQSYKRLKLRAFKEWLFRKTNEDKFVSSESILSRMSLCSYFVSWKIYLFTCKKMTFMSSTEMMIPFRIIYFSDWGMKKDVFFGINFCDKGILLKKCGIYFCDPNVQTNFFQRSPKNKIWYIWE